MGTRGFIGFVIDKEEKLTYNHWDSYPSGLGAEFLAWLREKVEKQPVTLQTQVAQLRMVTDEDPVTGKDIEHLKQFHNVNVSTGSELEWYSLLRETQGKPEAILEAEVALDAGDFPLDSLFCEWGYLVDLDNNTFEVYQGFQKQAHDEGRFADRHVDEERRGDSQYYPVKLVASWPLDELPTEQEMTDLERSEK